MKILWLASWYPSRVNLLNGDFIERHAKAAALYDNIVVIYVVKDLSIKNKKAEIEERRYSNNLTAYIIYYPFFSKLRMLEVLQSNLCYVFLHWKALSLYKRNYGRPEGVLVQVGMKAGVIAYLWKILFDIPFILFERWGGLLYEAKPNFRDQSWVSRWLWKLVLSNSKNLVTISGYLGKSINQYIAKKKFLVIPNTVNEKMFYPVLTTEPPPFQFIHVSTLCYTKNFEHILEATRLVKKEHPNLRLIVYGPVKEHLVNLTKALSLEDIVEFKGEVCHEEIAKAMQQSHALILYSRFESFGNVIIEANACGLPVIVSDIPVFHEIVKEKVTGVFAPGENPPELSKKMIWMIKNYKVFNPQIIHDFVRAKYNASVIGQKFHFLFQSSFTSK